jgi:NADPH:quinone reductase
MRAVEISSFGGPEVLRLVERPTPVPQSSEVLIRVAAAGVARADIMQRKGHYPPPAGASDIPGLDVSGVIEAVGPDAQQWKVGDRVCAIVTGCGYAEFCAVPAVQVLPVPPNWSLTEAATLPENLFTVYDNLITRAVLSSRETLLIHGGASGIGSMAIMLARAWNAVPIATAGTREKCAACVGLGAQEAINYRESDFVAEVQRITKGHGVDLILDMVGGPYLDRNLDCLAVEGRLTIVSVQGGPMGQLDIGKLMRKRARVMGSTMRNRTSDQKGLVAQRLLENVWPLLPARDPIRPVIDSTFPLRNARLAHERLEAGAHVGKIILVPD